MEDHELVERYWQRDETVLEDTRQQYGGYCFAIAQNLLGCWEDSEECVSDTWLRAWQSMPPQRPGKLSLFLGKITRNLSLARLRDQRAQKRGGGQGELALEELRECIPSPSDPQRETEERELAQSMNAFLRALPRKECSLFLARYWYAYSLGEIGRAFAMKEGTVKASLFRIRKKLKLHLEKEGVFL